MEEIYKIMTSDEGLKIMNTFTSQILNKKIEKSPIQEKLLNVFLDTKKTDTTEEIIDKVLNVQFTEEQKEDLLSKAENDTELKEQFEKMAEIARNFPMKN